MSEKNLWPFSLSTLQGPLWRQSIYVFCLHFEIVVNFGAHFEGGRSHLLVARKGRIFGYLLLGASGKGMQ